MKSIAQLLIKGKQQSQMPSPKNSLALALRTRSPKSLAKCVRELPYGAGQGPLLTLQGAVDPSPMQPFTAVTNRRHC